MTRSRYEIELSGVLPESGSGDELRNVSTDDVEPLAYLMLESYRGTIDYEDEDLDDARAEVRSFFDIAPWLEHSYLATVDGTVVSAVLVSTFEDAPFISYVMTLPGYKNQGWARRVVGAALVSLASAGHQKVVLYITDGNLPSEAVFRSLEALRVEE